MYFSSLSNSSSDPLVLWLNGGPGCSSLFGAFAEIGPFLTPRNYSLGDRLNPNQHAWNQKANLLFFESPAGVGFSTDKKDAYTDVLTAGDNLQAIVDFINNKAPELRGRPLFIAGESYAGKYIPDLAALILSDGRLNLRGILVGNGVFRFSEDSLTKSQMEYMISHRFIEQEFRDMYMTSCRVEWGSPRCRLFRSWFGQLRRNFNVYNVYEVCEPAQAAQLRLLLEK